MFGGDCAVDGDGVGVAGAVCEGEEGWKGWCWCLKRWAVGLSGSGDDPVVSCRSCVENGMMAGQRRWRRLFEELGTLEIIDSSLQDKAIQDGVMIRCIQSHNKGFGRL